MGDLVLVVGVRFLEDGLRFLEGDFAGLRDWDLDLLFFGVRFLDFFSVSDLSASES